MGDCKNNKRRDNGYVLVFNFSVRWLHMTGIEWRRCSTKLIWNQHAHINTILI